MLPEAFLARTAADVGRPALAVLPVGAFEQHGGHLPLRDRQPDRGPRSPGGLAENVGGLLLPVLPISCSQEHSGFPGTVWLTAGTLAAVVADIRASLAHSGIERLAIVNAHGGNLVLAHLVREANLDGPRVWLGPGRHIQEAAFAAAGIETGVHDDMHAGEYETSVLLHCWPHLVRMEAAADELAERPLLAVRGLAAYSRSGVVGRPTRATAEKGSKALEAMTAAMAAEVGEVFGLEM